jgi:hypothetical protein
MFHHRLLPALLVFASLLPAAEVTVSAGDELARKPAAERAEAVRSRWQPTPMTLPEGHLVLADVVTMLAANGNTVTLAPDVAGAAAGDFPGYAGEWWGAVQAVCEAFSLEIAPGQEAGGEGWARGDDEGQPLQVSAGPLLLVPRSSAPANPRLVCGPLLLEVDELALTRREAGDERWADFAVRARIEPRFPLRGVGHIAVRWDKAMAGDTALAIQPHDGDGDEGARLRLAGLPAEAARLALSATITVHALSPLHIELAPGDTAHIDLGEHQLVLRLFDAEQAKAAGKRTPCATLTYPAAALAAAAELTVSADGKPVPSRGSGTRQGRDAECEQTRYFAALADVSHDVVIDTMQPLGDCQLALDAALDLAALPTTPLHGDSADAADTAASIVLPGGERTLGEALALLRGSGNEVLVDLGIDARARATLPSARLGFWDATGAVAQAFHLEFMPPPAMAAEEPDRSRRYVRAQDDDAQGVPVRLCGGPLGLGQPHGAAPVLGRAACGPVLAELMGIERSERRTLAGTARRAAIRLRLRLEPRIPRDLVSAAQVVWSSAATGDGGERLVVGCGDDDGDGQADGAEPLQPGDLHTVLVSGLTAATRRFTLTGQLTMRLQRPVRVEAVLELGGAVVPLHLGQRGISAALVEGRNGEQGGLQLSYASDRANGDLQVTVRGPDGIELAQRGRSSSSNGRRQSETWHLAGLQPGIRYTVVVGANETLARPAIALLVPVELP